MVNVALYKASWCGHCVKYSNKWNELKNKLTNNKNVKITEYDWDNDKDIFDKMNVHSVPTLFINNVEFKELYNLDKIIEVVNNSSEKSRDDSLFNQQGGKNKYEKNDTIVTDLYKQKYLKYKIKYLELKKSNK